tara:strand:+ start:215 stop:676 length:462 start_codon:yes stop_codon:yes gene_type:complete
MIGSSYLKSGNIEDEIMSREWTLNDVLDMDKTVEDIVQNLIVGMDIESKYDIVKDIKYNEITLGELFTEQCRVELSNMVQFVVNNYLKTAKVEFNDTINNDKKKNKTVEVMVEKKDEQLLEDNQNEKIITLKQRINNDTKQLDENEKKKLGMV